MAKRKTDIEEVAEEVVADADAIKKATDSVTVSWGGVTRVYSKEEHGDDYKKLAEEFAEKKGGEIV